MNRMECKNCIHYKLCRDNDLDYDDNVVIKSTCGECLHYTDRSEWVHLPDEEYTFTVRGDIALGIIIANCRAAEAEKALEEKK